MDLSKFFQSKAFKIIFWGMAALIIILTVFKVGMMIGERRADFSKDWGDNYHRNFAGPKEGFPGNLPFGGQDFIEANGAFGQVIETGESTMVIKSPDNVEKVVSVDDKTIIKRFQEILKMAGLKAGDNVVIIGDPGDDGQIKAKFIRVLPSQGSFIPSQGRRDKI
ncbi:MAG: hypothetical protein WC397_02625 [Candidatus Paceibacterota bacterium]|jgi:hypothetical protein